MEPRVPDAGAGEAERASGAGPAGGSAAPGPAVASSPGAARWRLLRQVRRSPQPPRGAGPRPSLGRAGRGQVFSPRRVVGSHLRSVSWRPLRVPSGAGSPVRAVRGGAAHARGLGETPSGVDSPVLDFCPRLPARRSEGRELRPLCSPLSPGLSLFFPASVFFPSPVSSCCFSPSLVLAAGLAPPPWGPAWWAGCGLGRGPGLSRARGARRESPPRPGSFLGCGSYVRILQGEMMGEVLAVPPVGQFISWR